MNSVAMNDCLCVDDALINPLLFRKNLFVLGDEASEVQKSLLRGLFLNHSQILPIVLCYAKSEREILPNSLVINLKIGESNQTLLTAFSIDGKGHRKELNNSMDLVIGDPDSFNDLFEILSEVL